MKKEEATNETIELAPAQEIRYSLNKFIRPLPRDISVLERDGSRSKLYTAALTISLAMGLASGCTQPAEDGPNAEPTSSSDTNSSTADIGSTDAKPAADASGTNKVPALSGKAYEPVRFQLPEGKSMDDLLGVSIWCVDVGVSFGDARFSP